MLLLASASPRRAELLTQLGVDFQAKPVDINETPLPEEPADTYVSRMSFEKAQAARKLFPENEMAIITADTSVIIENTILGKPKDFADFERMMKLLSGKKHQVYTALTVLYLGNEQSLLNKNSVYFSHLGDQDILWYWQTGEPLDKAGGYAIQGLGSRFVSKIEGSYSGIVGLPLFETAEILSNFGILDTKSTKRLA